MKRIMLVLAAMMVATAACSLGTLAPAAPVIVAPTEAPYVAPPAPVTLPTPVPPVLPQQSAGEPDGEFACTTAVPEGFTSQRCFKPSTSPLVVGTMYYKGGYDASPQLAGIGVAYSTNDKNAAEIGARFVVEAAMSGGWNVDDIVGVTKLLGDGKLHTFGTVAGKITFFTSSNGTQFITFAFVLISAAGSTPTDGQSA